MRLAINRLCLSRRADSFYQSQGEYTLVEANWLSNPKLRTKILNYVLARQNDDGGYCFAQGALESGSQDTYYGLAILSELESTFPNPEKTMQFLIENRVDSIYSIYYTAKAQLLLCKEISSELRKEIGSKLESSAFYGSSVFFCDSSELAITLMALELSKLVNVNLEKTKMTDWLLSFQNADCGFGPQGTSNIDSTYNAIACLSQMERRSIPLEKTLRFIRRCEKPSGGFTVIPLNFNPYMEYSYDGVMALGLLGEKSKYPSQTIDWVLNCQKNTGGFSRSDLGIATFVDTYYAIEILKSLSDGGA